MIGVRLGRINSEFTTEMSFMALPISYSSEDIVFIRQRILKGDVPQHLYKYRSIDSVKQLLENHKVYFSNCKEFNDPFESAINILSDYTPQQYYESFIFGDMTPEVSKELTRQIVCGIIDVETLLKQLTKNVISSVGYYCMTTKPDNLLMWAHYGDSHKGVCLKFDILKDIDTFLVPVPVDYNEHYIDFNMLSSDLLSVLRRKSPEWKYEDEYRIIKTDYQGLWEIKTDCLVEIIFGCRTSEEDKKEIKKLAISSGFTNVKFSEARMKKDSYGLEIRGEDIKRIDKRYGNEDTSYKE